MFEKLRAFLAHFGEVAHRDASQLAHVPSELWADVKAAFSDPVDAAAADVHATLTSAEASVVHGSSTAVQLAAGDLAKLHDIVAAVDPKPVEEPKESASTENPTDPHDPSALI